MESTKKRNKPNASFKLVIEKVHKKPYYPKELQKQTKLVDRVVDACLKRGVYLRIFRQLKDKRYAWIDYIPLEEELVKIIEEHRKTIFGEPTDDQLARYVGVPPEKPEFRTALFRVSKRTGLGIPKPKTFTWT